MDALARKGRAPAPGPGATRSDPRRLGKAPREPKARGAKVQEHGRIREDAPVPAWIRAPLLRRSRRDAEMHELRQLPRVLGPDLAPTISLMHLSAVAVCSCTPLHRSRLRRPGIRRRGDDPSGPPIALFSILLVAVRPGPSVRHSLLTVHVLDRLGRPARGAVVNGGRRPACSPTPFSN